MGTRVLQVIMFYKKVVLFKILDLFYFILFLHLSNLIILKYFFTKK